MANLITFTGQAPTLGAPTNPHTHIMTDENNEDVKSSSLVRYVVVTSYGYWGKAPELEVALKNANVNSFYALNSKKKGKACHIYRVELDPVNSVFNEESRKGLKSQHVTFTGYEEGDLIEPWVNDWGNVSSWGAKSCELVIKLQIR